MDESLQDRFFDTVGKPLVVGLFFSLYALFVRLYVFPKYSFLLTDDFELIQNFIEWFGVAYGLFIALVLVNVWSQYDTVEREFDREADAVFMLYQAVNQINQTKKTQSSKKEIISRIEEYVKHVISNYKWEHENLEIRDNGDQKLESIRDFIGDLAHTKEPEALTSQLVKEYNEAVDVRGDRISHSKQHLPDPLWGISLASSILWLIPFYGLDFKNDLVAIFLVGGVTAIVVAILVIMRDLDDPFEGTWKISTDEWELLGEKIGLKPTLYFVYNLDNNRFSTAWAFIRRFFPNHPCILYALLHATYWSLPDSPHPPSTSDGISDPQENIAGDKKGFFSDLEDRAYCKVSYRDDFETLYKKIDPLPVVFYKSKSKKGVMVNPAEIREVATPADLMKLIQERLTAFSSFQAPAK